MVRARRRRTPRTAQPPATPTSAGMGRNHPWLAGAVIALFVARPLFPSEATASQGDGLPVVMLWLALGLLWLLAVVSRRQWELRFGWIDLAVAGLVGWHTIAGVYAAWHAAPRPAVNTLWEWIGLGIAFFLARQLLVGQRTVRAACVVMVALATGVGVYGLYQYGVELPATRAYYEQDPEAALKQAGLEVNIQSREARLFRDRLYSTEPMATFALTNSLAGFLVPWLVLALGIALGSAHVPATAPPYDLAKAERNKAANPMGLRPRLGVLACAVLMAAVLILTKSRTAYVATAVGLGLVGRFVRCSGWRIRWHWLAGLGATGVILVVVAAAIGGLDMLVLWEAGKSALYRLQYWRATLAMIYDRPWLGCGPGNFQASYTRYMLPTASEEIADPHNLLLEVWATAGTPGALALLAVVLGLVSLALRQPGLVAGQDAAINAIADGSAMPVGNAWLGTAWARPGLDRAPCGRGCSMAACAVDSAG